MKYLIGLDMGTSSVKGVLMDEEGNIIKTAKGSFTYHVSAPSRSELVPEEYLKVCYGTIRDLAAGVQEGAVKGLCASTASGNLVALDRQMNPLTEIIGWQDGRVGDEALQVLGGGREEEVYKKVGWPFGYRGFPLAQLCYLKVHRPEVLKNCGMVCMSTEYLYYTLTGKWGISGSAGTPFYLIDQEKGTYLTEFLEMFGLTQEQVPPVYGCGYVVGGLTKEGAALCGLTEGTPVVLGSFDHPSAARGAGVTKEGQMLLSCGTSWVAFLPVATREQGIRGGLLVDPFLSPEGPWAVMSSVASLAARLELYVHRYIDDSPQAYSRLSALAAASCAGAHGLVIHPLEEPEDDRILKYGKEDIARAIMEGTVYLLKERLEDLKRKGIHAESAVMVGGPSEDPFWMSLIQEICGIPVEKGPGAYAGAVGAALMAGKAVF